MALVFSLYFIRTVVALLYHLFWWDLKEFRTDRMIVHLRQTYQGRHMLFNYISIIKWLVLFLYIFLPLSYYSLLNAIVLIFLLIDCIKPFVGSYTVKRPAPFLRLRVVSVFLASFFVLCFFVFILTFDFPLGFAILVGDKLLALTVFSFIVFSQIPFGIYKRIKLHKAFQKLKAAKHLQIIGITGSFGKSTTKEFIAQLLSKQYKILYTSASHNTDIGIAETILLSDFTDIRYFVCELAAYKRGEIKAITKLFGNKLKIAVITGINEQHQSLFGSMENTLFAKYELFQALSKNGYAVINTFDKRTNTIQDWCKRDNIKVKKLMSITPNDKSKLFIENKILAGTVAKLCKLNQVKIQSLVLNLQPLSGTMTVLKKNGFELIDDSFNANPDGVLYAYNYISKKKSKKYLVLQPLIELGSFADSIHENLGQRAADVFDCIVLTNKNFNKPFLKGVLKTKGNLNSVFIGKMPQIKKKGVYLFEGKESKKYLKKFI